MDSNQSSRSEITLLKPEAQTFSAPFHQIKEPQEVKSYTTIHRTQPSNERDELAKLATMNNILSESYDQLYSELQELKNGQVCPSEVVSEDLFFRKTNCQIENIFNVETFEALSKLHDMERSKKNKSAVKGQKKVFSMTDSFYM